MQVVYKYPIANPDFGPTAIHLPPGSRFLAAAMQHDSLVVWALCALSSATETRHLLAVNTGMPFDYTLAGQGWIGTATHPNGAVWHVFEVSP